MPLDNNIKLILEANPGFTIEEANDFYTQWKRHKELAARPQVSSGQVLAEQNRPLSQGFSTFAQEGARGVSEIAQVLNNPLTATGGMLRTALSPTVGAGAAVGTTAQNVLANVPGLGGASGVIPASGAAIADALTQVGLGPGIIKGTAALGKAGLRGVAKFIAPGELREAGVEIAAGKLGRPQELIARVLAEPTSKRLFKEMEQAENVPIRPIYDLVEGVFQKEVNSNLPEFSTINILNTLKGSLKASLDNPNLTQSYEALADTTQRLGGKARALIERRPNTARNLYELRASILDKMDEISPTIKKANAEYRKELATDDLLLSLRNSDPGAQFKRLLEMDRSLAKAFDPKDLRELQNIAEEMSTIASTVPAGGFRQVMSVITEAPRKMFTNPKGRALLRNSMQPVSTTGMVNPKRIYAAVQLWNAKEHTEKVLETMKKPGIPIEQKIAAAQMQTQMEQQLQQTIGEAP